MLFISDSCYFCSKNIKHLIVIEGPTASGKTSLSVAIAKQLNCSILSADSRQFYTELSIGTAKPTIQEQNGIQHYFIDSHSVENEVSAAQFEKEALIQLNEIYLTNNIAILVGGSGMFIDALCIGLDPIPSSSELRNTINLELEKNGISSLLNELKEKDPVYFKEVDQQNPMRIIRAIEVIRLTNRPYSEFRIASPIKRPFKVHRFVINHSREKLYERINQRVDIMMAKGLLEEVKSVIQFRNLASLNTVGYKELFNYLDGKYKLEEAVQLIKQNSRRYAKRQITWFKRHPESIWLDFTNIDDMVKKIIKTIELTVRT